MVQGLDFDSEYDIDFDETNVPDDIIYMPSSMYSTIKQIMLDCVEDMNHILYSEAITDEEYELKANSKYTDGVFVYTLKYLADDRWYYDLFRIEEENISPRWRGNGIADSLHDRLRPITENTYQKVLERFNSLQTLIAKHLEDKQ